MGAMSRRAALLLVLILNRIASAASETEREWFMREGAQRGEAKKRRGRMGDEMMKMREYYCAQEPTATICATLRGDATEGRRRMPRHPPTSRAWFSGFNRPRAPKYAPCISRRDQWATFASSLSKSNADSTSGGGAPLNGSRSSQMRQMSAMRPDATISSQFTWNSDLHVCRELSRTDASHLNSSSPSFF